jgi:hypothetical protein
VSGDVATYAELLFGARCKLGSDLGPRSITIVMYLGLLGAVICSAIDRPVRHTHSPEQGGGGRCLPNSLDAFDFRAINSCLSAL